LDFVIAAVHTWRRDEDVTERILRAMENPYVHSIAHPTGRLIGKREGYRVDMGDMGIIMCKEVRYGKKKEDERKRSEVKGNGVQDSERVRV
jgi:DNA polymerase (family 10)